MSALGRHCRAGVALAAGVVVGLVGTRLDAGAIFIPPAAGIIINADGVLSLQQQDDPGGQLLKNRIAAARAALNQDMQKSSTLRKVSLQRLEAAVQKRHKEGAQADDAMNNLAGLTRIQYVFYLPETKDIVIAGPAEGFVQNTVGRMVGIESGHATVQLEDLVVALRTFGPKVQGRKHIGCSIDPTQKGLVAMQNTVAQAHRQWRRPPNNVQIAQFIDAMRTALGPQDIRVFGVSSNTHFAQVMIEADYRMKLLGIGLEAPPKGVKLTSYVARANPRSVARNALQRWYFVPDYKTVRVTGDALGMELVGQGVKLVGEDEAVGADGARAQAGPQDRASQAYVDNFTKVYPKLAERAPIYAQLRTLIDLAISSAFIQQRDYFGKAGWQMGFFGDENQFRVERYYAPKNVMPAATAVWKGKTLMTPIGGGVSMDPQRALHSSNLLEDDDAKVEKLRAGVSLKDLPADKWWWD